MLQQQTKNIQLIIRQLQTRIGTAVAATNNTTQDTHTRKAQIAK